MNDYQRLRELLLKDEIEAIKEIKQTISSILRETTDKEIIISRLSEVFPEIFEKNSQNEKFLKVLNPIIAHSLSDNIKNSTDELAEIMAPIMGNAIKEQVKTQKDAIIDALYPVIGNMITKYVSETFKDLLNQINLKMQEAFSSESIKRKIKAKLKGIPESELILQEVNTYKVEAVFLIQKETGILISSRSTSEIEEADMVASMLSAIRSFVNDWVAKNSDNVELNSIEYGDSNIYLEVAGCCYLAVVVKGVINKKFSNKVREVLFDIVEENSDVLNNFEGDFEKVNLNFINTKLDEIINSSKQTSQRIEKEGSFFINYILSIVFIFFISFFIAKSIAHIYDDYVEKKINNFIYKNNVIYGVKAEVNNLDVYLKGKVRDKSIKEQYFKIIKNKFENYKIIDDMIILKHLQQKPMQQKPKTIDLENILNFYRLNGINIQQYNNNGMKYITAIVNNEDIKNNIISTLSKIYKNLLFNIKVIHLPNIKERIYFSFASAKIDELELKKISDIVKKYNLKYYINKLNKKLCIIGYADGKGQLKNNIKFSKKRALNVKKELVKFGLKKDNILVSYYPYPLEDNMKNPRVVVMKWRKNEN